LLALLSAVLCVALSGAAPLSAAPPPSGVPDASLGAAPWDLPSGSFPARYDLRALGRVTAVRLQDHHGTCPVMASIGSLESCLLPTRLDLSENNLANHQGSRLHFEGMAPSAIATAYFARWEGPVLERDDPYPRVDGSPEGLRAVRHVQEVLSLPARRGPLDNAPLKWALMTYGAVDAEMAWENTGFNGSTSSYYLASASPADHHVCVAGWNDEYPASRFARRPPGDGAFLIKNSWGAGWGAGGYFWLSYYDAVFGRALTVFNGAEGAGNHDAIYQHDALGRTRGLGLGSSTAWFANRFLCAGTGTLSAVSFYTPVPGSRYEVRVAEMVAGVVTAPPAARGTIAVAGYHTVRLETPAAVTAGQRFVVAVRLTTPGYSRPVPLEHPSSLVTSWAARGQSYVSADGSRWTDLTTRSGYAHSNVCLKAFVDAPAGADERSPRALIDSVSASPGGLVRVRYHLNDPEFSCASAAVVLKVRDSSGRVIVRKRVPAVVVGQHRVWSFGGPLRRGSYQVGVRAYDVAGNRQGTASRAALRVQ
jgi:C1A family cysteine protease